MSFVFCLSADGLLFDRITTHGYFVSWITAMHTTSPPEPGVWYRVPSNLLPDGATVCYFNSNAFMEEVVLPSFATTDTRPLITPRWRQENSEEWDRLWILNRTEECPVCHEKPDIWDGPMNSDVASRCTHWACVSCWARIAQRDKRCPVCRDDLSVWLARHDTDSDEEEEGDAMDEEQGVFCEACDSYHRQGIVAWYREPFTHDGRNLYSACGVCRRRLNLEDRPVLHW